MSRGATRGLGRAVICRQVDFGLLRLLVMVLSVALVLVEGAVDRALRTANVVPLPRVSGTFERIDSLGVSSSQ